MHSDPSLDPKPYHNRIVHMMFTNFDDFLDIEVTECGKDIVIAKAFADFYFQDKGLERRSRKIQKNFKQTVADAGLHSHILHARRQRSLESATFTILKDDIQDAHKS